MVTKLVRCLANAIELANTYGVRVDRKKLIFALYSDP